MRFVVALFLGAVVAHGADPAAAQLPALGGTVGEAVHWCTFERACNWSAHASIAAGIVWGLRRADVGPELAATVAALVFVGKEIRDDAKWGGVLGTRDSMADMLSGVLGAYVGYRLFGGSGPVQLTVTPADGTTVEVRLPVP